MVPHGTALLLVVGLSAVGVLGDYFLKRASGHSEPFFCGAFFLGFAAYSSTAFGWVMVMRELKLATIGAVYCVSTVLFLTGLGVVLGERLSKGEAFGVILAVSSMVLLSRYA